MYALWHYLRMIRDAVRVTAYRAAIEATVREGDVVLDLGAGVGTMSFLALEAGAAHVYAIEMNDVAEWGRRIAEANGYADQITWIQDDCSRVSLPKPADVMIADLRGALPLVSDGLRIFADARDRLLTADGPTIPRSDVVCLAPVDFPEGFADVEGWGRLASTVDYSSLEAAASNQIRRYHMSGEALLAGKQVMAHIDYRTMEPADFALDAHFVVERAGHCNGLAAWFETDLAHGVSFSTGPDQLATIYGQLYLPLQAAQGVRPGDAVRAQVRALFAQKDYLWLWNVSIEGRGREPVEEQHSSYRGTVLDLDRLRRRAPGYVPVPGLDLEIDRRILVAIDGQRSLGEIAADLVNGRPSLLPDLAAASARVIRVIERYRA